MVFERALPSLGLVVLALGLTGCAGMSASNIASRKQAISADRPGGFTSNLGTDILSTAGMLAVGILVDQEKALWSGVSPCAGLKAPPGSPARRAAATPGPGVCDKMKVPWYDRPVTRFKSSWARPASDLALLGMVALPYGVSAGHTGTTPGPARSFGVDAVVITQTLSATLLSTTLLKVLVARARPLTYSADFEKTHRFSGDARLSMPSGHSAMAFSAASVTAVMLHKRYPGSGLARVGIAGAYLGAAAVAGLRVAAAKHFFSDVLAGAVLGTVLGLAIPLSHMPQGETSSGTAGQNVGTVSVLNFGGAF